MIRGEISKEESKYRWEPEDTILRAWWIMEDGKTLKCMNCDFTIPDGALEPIKREMHYAPVGTGYHWPNLVGYFVDVDPGLEYYKKRYRIGKAKQDHWDVSHLQAKKKMRNFSQHSQKN